MKDILGGVGHTEQFIREKLSSWDREREMLLYLSSFSSKVERT